MEYASMQEESMIRQICLMALSIAAVLLTFFSGKAAASDYERDTIFYDDFSAGSMENWDMLLGEWLIDDAKLCQLACSS